MRSVLFCQGSISTLSAGFGESGFQQERDPMDASTPQMLPCLGKIRESVAA
jgi:hypothetical protein